MGDADNNIMENIRYKESWRKCKCGSRIVFNAHLPGKIPEMCKKCQEIATMQQTCIKDFLKEQKTIEYFGSDE